MMQDSSNEGGGDRLKLLIPLTPDPDRRERVRLRCRMQLERDGRRRNRATKLIGFTARVLAPAIVGGFCLVYVAALLATTLRLEGILQ